MHGKKKTDVQTPVDGMGLLLIWKEQKEILWKFWSLNPTVRNSVVEGVVAGKDVCRIDKC
jgi:hypothetical protein